MAEKTVWLCTGCGYIYDPALGDPKGGVAPGVDFNDLPPDWRCPDCGEIMPEKNEECERCARRNAPDPREDPEATCRHCGYLLWQLPQRRCPECGHEF